MLYCVGLFSVSVAVSCFHEVSFVESSALQFDEGQEEVVDSYTSCFIALLCLNVCFLKQQLQLACHFELVTPETTDYMSPARVDLAGIDYKIFVFVICRYVEVTINA